METARVERFQWVLARTRARALAQATFRVHNRLRTRSLGAVHPLFQKKKNNNGGSADKCHRPRRGSWNRVP